MRSPGNTGAIFTFSGACRQKTFSMIRPLHCWALWFIRVADLSCRKLRLNLQGSGFARLCISADGKRHMNCQIHANCFWKTCSVNEHRQPLQIKLQLWRHQFRHCKFLYNCNTQSVGHRNSGSVCKKNVLEVIVCRILGFKLGKVKNDHLCVVQ